MHDPDTTRPIRLSRRDLLVGAGALTGAVAVGSGSATFADAAGATPLRWPTRKLRAKDAASVDASQFLSVAQLTLWHEELDAMGMRSTGSPVHERFIDVLMSRLKLAGVTQVHAEPVPFTRWTAGTWSLELGRPHAEGRIATSSYIPYSGSTPPGGVTGPLALIRSGQTPAPGSLAGKIAVFEVPSSPISYSLMEEISYARYDPEGPDRSGEDNTRGPGVG